MACTFQATIGGKFALLIGLSDENMGPHGYHDYHLQYSSD